MLNIRKLRAPSLFWAFVCLSWPIYLE